MRVATLFACLSLTPFSVHSNKYTYTPSGVDITQYSGHSFRIGAASTVAAVGIEDPLIKTLGRWESTVYLSYVRVPRDRLAAVSKQLSSLAEQ